jgi:hypothetical protein
MGTLAKSISAAVTKSLLAKLPSEASERFEVNEDEFKEFLQSFLAEQLTLNKKRTPTVKGLNGKGAVTGFLLFSNSHRDATKAQIIKENADLSPTEVFRSAGRRLGESWGELSDAQKAEWKANAIKANEDNGLPTPTPSSTPAAKKQKAASDSSVQKIARHPDANVWVMQGTNFAVKSSKNKMIVGKVRANKVVTLSAADVKKCESNGWTVQER